MGLSRRKFTKEFKEEAVRRLELGASFPGGTTFQVEAELFGIA